MSWFTIIKRASQRLRQILESAKGLLGEEVAEHYLNRLTDDNAMEIIALIEKDFDTPKYDNPQMQHFLEVVRSLSVPVTTGEIEEPEGFEHWDGFKEEWR